MLPDLIAAVGLDPATVETEVTPGGYLLETNASLQSRAPVDDATADKFAAALGYVFRQYSVLVSDLSDARGVTGYVTVSFPGGALDADLAHRFFEHAASIADGLGGGYTAFGDDMIFLNVRDEAGAPYSGLDDAAFAAGLRKAAQTFSGPEPEVTETGVADARFVGNDWDAAPEGEEYVSLLGGADAPLVDALDDLQERHTDMVLRAAEAHGWQ